LAETKLRFKLKELLEDHNMSINELARRIEHRPSTVADLAAGRIKRIPVDLLEKVCEELECGVSDIIDFPTHR